MTADTVGGVWTFSLELMRALRSDGIQFALATMGRPLDREQRQAIARLDHVELFESEYKLEWMQSPWRDVDAAGDWLMGIADDFQPDAIHLNNYTHGDLPWNRPVLMVAHSCVFSWFTAVKGENPPPEWITYRSRVRRGLEAATLVTAPSQTMLQQLAKHYSENFTASNPIHNGRSNLDFRPTAKKPFILTGGRLWDEAKNIRLLEAAAPETRWPIRIAGAAEHPDGGQADFKNLQSLGFLTQSQFADQLSRAAIYALPARYEPFGLSALEAALSGCALVLADIPSLREIWHDTAIFLPPDDPSAWSETFNRLADDPHALRKLSEKSRRQSERYTSARMAREYLRCYELLLETKPDQNEDNPVLPFASLGLEPRQRALPARIRH